MVNRTKTFVGSSTEGLPIAKAIESQLSEVTDVLIWTEGVFLPGHTYVETLEKLIEEVDYAVLIASPDDLLVKRDVENFSMRDNVLLELGLFMAKLGRHRTYLITPRNLSIHIPTDLLGVKTVSFDLSADANTAIENASFVEACREVRRAMQESEKELSSAMRRVLIKRLLEWTTKINELVAFAQAESVKSLLDRAQFERIRKEMGSRIVALLDEQKEDALRLRITEQYERLKATLIAAIEELPFPEEAVISTDEMVGGMLSHFIGGKSIQDQFKKRIESLMSRFEGWWNKYRMEIARTLGEFQAELIRKL